MQRCYAEMNEKQQSILMLLVNEIMMQCDVFSEQHMM